MRVDRADEGFQEVDAFVPAEGRGAAVDPPRSANPQRPSLAFELRAPVDARRETGGNPSSASPLAREDGRPVDVVGARPATVMVEAESARRDAEPGDGDADEGEGLREVVTVVEREARPEARREARTPIVGTRAAPAVETREEAEAQRPVIRVTIGRIEVRAAPQPPAPAPAARKGWTPPVTPLDEYLKREPGR
jgi:hypothetical protein